MRYAHLDVEDTIAQFQSQLKKNRVKATKKMVAKAHTHDSMQALRKLTTQDGGQRRIISDPPLIQPVEEVFPDAQAGAIYQLLRETLGKYRRSLQSDRKHLLEAFTLIQVARKVGGWERRHPLLDRADGRRGRHRAAVLAAQGSRGLRPGGLLRGSHYASHGERVVAGQLLMQAESDIFLGWTNVTGPDGVDRDYYVRQLKDWKFSFPIEQMIPSGMAVYAQVCGWTLARAHARSGDRIALAAYLGGTGKFDQAIADFAEAYADQNDRDYAALQAAVKDGRAQTTTDI